MFANADRIVVVCQWLYDALIKNGAPQHKLILSRQGISPDLTKAINRERRALFEEPLRLLFLGRMSRVKGVDIIVRAMKQLPNYINAKLTIHAVTMLEEDDYYIEICKLAHDDPRIEIKPPIKRDELPDVLNTFDALLVPSQWLETGPLVVLEAQAAGLFILGSRLGGIAELIREEADGELIESPSVEAWATAIVRLWRRYRAGMIVAQKSVVRTMDDVAQEMVDLYRIVGDRK
jgi:glycosyltransferase involved in cell wall biosynthesis